MAKRIINEPSFDNKNSGTGGQLEDKDIVRIVNVAVEAATKPIKDDLNEYKVKIIEVLAIFVALFTFVSVDIQIFKSEISILSAAGFTLIMLAGLVFFVIILAYLLDDKRINNLKLLCIIIFLVVIGGFGVYWVGRDYDGVEKTLKEKFYTTEQLYTNEQTDEKIASSTAVIENQLNDFKKCLKEGGWNKCF